VHLCVATCLVVPDAVSQPGWAPELPCVQWLQIPPPDRKSSGAATCNMASDPTSL
jgi:hypothetical protein